MATLIRNKQISHDYKILEEFEAGFVLNGQEVKTIKSGLGSLRGAFVSIKDSSAYIKKMHIPIYSKASTQSKQNYNPDRDRRILLKKKEISYLIGKTNQKGLTIVPISVYTTRRLIKVKIALVKGKKKFDKRETIKQRDTQRRILRKLKDF
ncbi:SsrA-binding protein SmpB [Candidatus Parcubacteria bacterium]|jgi:SsrA-binding protein|nr:SsrA-binding protein SmpB [Candidatus Parcubacteria bacterium]MBT7227999.1 SsrA-binding protein SmpB [Candidatus Parcubacteria bacterium]